jgi:hypothetical protein
MDFFKDHAVLFALVLRGGVAIAYGVGLTVWLSGKRRGNERMRDISRAVQEGAAAYLRRLVPDDRGRLDRPVLLIGFYNELGWGTAIGFLIGATLSAAAGFIGMNVAVRSNARTAEAARDGLAPRSTSPSARARSPGCSSSASACSASRLLRVLTAGFDTRRRRRSTTSSGSPSAAR